MAVDKMETKNNGRILEDYSNVVQTSDTACQAWWLNRSGKYFPLAPASYQGINNISIIDCQEI